MTIEILTVLPELLTSPFEHSIMKRAQERGHLHIKLHQLRKWAINKHGQVDDYQYGGGAGMVIMCEPLANAIDELQQEGKFDEIIFVTPDGKIFDQKDANTLSLKNRILIICGQTHSRIVCDTGNFHWRLCVKWWRISSSGYCRRRGQINSWGIK